jgi:hypothetical protein
MKVETTAPSKMKASSNGQIRAADSGENYQIPPASPLRRAIQWQAGAAALALVAVAWSLAGIAGAA